jgi:hypothetical protein
VNAGILLPGRFELVDLNVVIAPPKDALASPANGPLTPAVYLLDYQQVNTKQHP